MAFGRGGFPPSINIDGATGRIRYFMNDRWITIGQAKMVCMGSYIQMEIPDIRELLTKHLIVDDGTKNWIEWGPRLN